MGIREVCHYDPILSWDLAHHERDVMSDTASWREQEIKENRQNKRES